MARFPRSRPPRSRFLALLAVAVCTLALASGCSMLQGAAAAPVCQDVTVPVSLPTGEHGVLAGTYCRPARSEPSTIMVLVHGGTYNRDYWMWPQDGGEYNFADRAVDAGYATLAIDRLGDGASLRPISSHDTANAQVATLHQMLQAVRGGHLGVRYQHLVWVGHSFGSYYGVSVESRYPHDVDAMILTGFGAHYSQATKQIDAADDVPARSLVRYKDEFPSYARFSTLDPGYITNTPGTRGDQLADGPDHHAPNEDPAVLEFDQATEDTLSVTELTTRPANLQPLMQRLLSVPILVMDGDFDLHYCGPGVYDCSSTATFFRGEATSFPAGSCLAAALEPSGHDLQLSRASASADREMLTWATRSLAPHGAASRCAVRGPIATSDVPLQ